MLSAVRRSEGTAGAHSTSPVCPVRDGEDCIYLGRPISFCPKCCCCEPEIPLQVENRDVSVKSIVINSPAAALMAHEHILRKP